MLESKGDEKGEIREGGRGNRSVLTPDKKMHLREKGNRPQNRRENRDRMIGRPSSVTMQAFKKKNCKGGVPNVDRKGYPAHQRMPPKAAKGKR